MTTSYSTALSALQKSIKDINLKVIALTGRWGTGKSHLVDSISDLTYPADRIIKVSIFGARDILEVKFRLLQAAMPAVIKNGNILTGLTRQIIKSGLNKVGMSIDDISLLGLPGILNNAFVVIDDIERKHNSLDVNEILGIISEYTNKYQTRFLLLLNTDQLHDKTTWTLLHEKVVDVEITLIPTPDDAFVIAAAGVISTFTQVLNRATSYLDINNIRLLKRLVKLASNVESVRSDWNLIRLESVAAVIAMLVAVHHGADNRPALEELLQLPDSKFFSGMEGEGYSKWNSWCKHFELGDFGGIGRILTQSLLSGALDEEKLRTELNSVQATDDQLRRISAASSAIDHSRWSLMISNTVFQDKVLLALPVFEKLNLYIIIDLFIEAHNLNIDEKVIVSMLSEYETTLPTRSLTDLWSILDLPHLPKRLLDQTNLYLKTKYGNVRLRDLIKDCFKGSEEARQILGVKEIKFYVQQLTTMDSETLKEVVTTLVDNPTLFDVAFNKFVQSADIILQDPEKSSSRLAKILSRHLSNYLVVADS